MCCKSDSVKGSVEADVSLSEKAEDKLQRIIARYPTSMSAVMPALYIAQEECGWLTDSAISWVAKRLSLTKVYVKQVATFYTMYYKAPVGKYHLQVCRTLPCMLTGCNALLSLLKRKLNVDAHQVTSDGFWSYEEVECLGSCGTGPVVQINDVYFERMTVEKLEEIMARIEKEEPNLRYSTVRDSLGKGMPDRLRSEVW